MVVRPERVSDAYEYEPESDEAYDEHRPSRAQVFFGPVELARPTVHDLPILQQSETGNDPEKGIQELDRKHTKEQKEDSARIIRGNGSDAKENAQTSEFCVRRPEGKRLSNNKIPPKLWFSVGYRRKGVLKKKMKSELSHFLARLQGKIGKQETLPMFPPRHLSTMHSSR